MVERNAEGAARFNAARDSNRKAADALLGVAQGKHRAAQKNPGEDTSAKVAAKAKREGWQNTGGGRAPR